MRDNDKRSARDKARADAQRQCESMRCRGIPRIAIAVGYIGETINIA